MKKTVVNIRIGLSFFVLKGTFSSQGKKLVLSNKLKVQYRLNYATTVSFPVYPLQITPWTS